MKKNLFKIFTVIVFATIAGYNLYNSQKTDMMSDLALENIEALAQSESSSGIRCYTGDGHSFLCICNSCVWGYTGTSSNEIGRAHV